MILTGEKIKREVNNGAITIDPFREEQLNPNSYNYRLGDKVLTRKSDSLKEEKIDEDGMILEPHETYLANTYETLGSEKYAMRLIGRSSLGRLGLFLQVSANLGHTGSEHKWTLELVATQPLKIYAEMIVGQISFWVNKGESDLYKEGYSNYSQPKESKLQEAKL